MSFHRYHRRGRVTALACACLPVALASQARAQSADSASLPPVVVTASRLPQSLPDALPHTTVLTEADIRASGAQDLPSLLKREAGTEFSQSGGIGSVSSLYLRGAESRQTVVLIDGVRVDSETVGGTAIDQIQLDQVERIEVVRGNVSALYGSGAVGGVVQIFTRSGRGAAGPSASVMAGSRGTAKVAAGYAGRQGATTYAFSASHFRTEGFSAVDTSLYPLDNPDRDGYRNDSLSGRLAHDWAPDQTLGVQLYATRGRLDYDNGGNFGSPTDVLTQKSAIDTVAVFSDNRLNAAWTSHLQLAQGHEENEHRFNGAFNGRFETRHHQVQWRNTLALAADHTLTAGVEADRQSIESDSGFGPALEKSRTLSAATLGYLGHIGQHELQANARYDRAGDFGSATTGLLGYGYALTPSLKLIGLASTAFTAPNLGQLYAPGFGNPDLQAERAKSVELGLGYTVGRGVLRATMFRTRVREQIDFDLTSFRYVNSKRVKNSGVELTYAGRLQSYDLRASLTHQQPEDEDTGAALLRRARTFGSLSVSRDWGAWTFGADVSSSDSRPDIGHTLGGYTLLDLRAHYRFDRAWSLAAKVENATDRRYQTAYGYNQAPRGVFLTLAWRP